MWNLDERDSERALQFGLALLAIIAFLKGFRPPSGWAATQLSFNYSHGFVRRGLAGELIRRVGGDWVYSYPVICRVSFAFLFASLWALHRLYLRARATGDADRMTALTALVFASSPALVMYVEEVGYLDQIGLLALLGLLLLIGSRRHPYAPYAAASVGGAVLAAVHEGLVPMFAPVAMFIMVCGLLRDDRDGAPRARLWLGLALTAAAFTCVVLAAWAVVNSGVRSRPALDALQKTVFERADYPPFAMTFDLLRSSFHESFHHMPDFWTYQGKVQAAIHQFLVVLPTLAFLMSLGGARILHQPMGWWRRGVLALGFVGATLAPLALNLIGWDSGRWNTIMIIDGVCCLLGMQLLLPQSQPPVETDHPPPHVPLALLALGVCAVAFGLCADSRLFMEFPAHYFPFDDQVATIGRFVGGGLRFLPGY